jgi:type III secretion system YscD/HrpQ family protein
MSIAAERFAGLLDLGSAPASGRAGDVPAFAPAARLLVRDGLHRGAWMSLRGERLRIGSADDGDIVLTDAGMPALAAHLVFCTDGWQLEAGEGGHSEAPAVDSRPIAAAAGESRHGRWRRRRWQLHGVTMIVIDAAPPASALPAARKRLVLRLALGAAATLLAITALVAIARIASPAPQARVAQALPSLMALKLPDVRLRGGDDGAIELVGHVADAAQFAQLSGWLQNSGVAEARLRVQVGTALVGQVRDALENLGRAPDVEITYAGAGRVRIEGSTRSSELKRRVQTLVTEMRGAVVIDDQLALVEGKDDAPAQRPLPIRIVNVMLGEAPYFQTDVGATYFIGSKLPDGAEVTAIAAMQIVFRLGQRDVIYRLDN